MQWARESGPSSLYKDTWDVPLHLLHTKYREHWAVWSATLSSLGTHAKKRRRVLVQQGAQCQELVGHPHMEGPPFLSVRVVSGPGPDQKNFSIGRASLANTEIPYS